MQGVILKKADDNIICSIQIQVVIPKRGVIQFGKCCFERFIAIFPAFSLCTSHYLRSVRGDYSKSALSSILPPVQLHCLFHDVIPVVLFTDKVGCLFLHFHYFFRMVTGILQFFSKIIYV